MPAGLQVWDANGNVVFDSTVKTTYVIGYANTGTSNGSLTDTNLVGRENSFWVCVVEVPEPSSFSKGIAIPDFTLADGVLSWTFSTGSFIEIQDIRFMYGVY